jgi:DNA-binding transcriptional ArsR family regulator
VDLAFIPGQRPARAGRLGSAGQLRGRLPGLRLLADPGARTAPTALRRLLGLTRADILRLLDRPASTTYLVAVTGLAVGTVSTHLRVMLDARLIERRRSGATVLYCRTPIGQEFLDRTASPDSQGTHKAGVGARSAAVPSQGVDCSSKPAPYS